MKSVRYLLAGFLTLAMISGLGTAALAQDQVTGLRGEVHMEDSSPAPATFKQDVPAQGFGRVSGHEKFQQVHGLPRLAEQHARRSTENQRNALPQPRRRGPG